MRNLNLLYFVLIFFLIESCSNSNLIKVHEFSSGWKNSEVVSFDFEIVDTLKKHDLKIFLRHNKNYEFSNIFMVTELSYNNEVVTDTLEFVLSEKSGKWLGDKKLSVVEHFLPFKKNLKLKKEIPYNLKIRNSMRFNNEISPIQSLENVLDLGLIIETSN